VVTQDEAIVRESLVELAIEAMKLGAADYLIKPVGPLSQGGLSGKLSLKAKVDVRKTRAYFCFE
jgi:DNA-binding NtrC family response regulator